MWQIIRTRRADSSGLTMPYGIRNEHGFVCVFAAPTHWNGQDARYSQECEQLDKRAEIMCAALNREAV